RTERDSDRILRYTRIMRTSSTIADTFVNELGDSKRQLRIMKDLVDESLSILNSPQDLTAFGELLHEGWQAKKGLSSDVSNSDVDQMYREARAAGAIGGKLMGAGGGGFMLLFVPPDQQKKVCERLNRLLFVPFKFEFSGSQI